MSRMLKLLFLNVRGLRNGNKRRAIFSYLKSQKVKILCLQENYSSPEDKKLWSAEWGASIIYSHGTTHSKGVCILLNPSSPFNLSSIQVDPEGRFLIAKLTIEEKYFFITNIYGPNNFHDQDNFIKTVTGKFTDFPVCVIRNIFIRKLSHLTISSPFILINQKMHKKTTVAFE